MLKPPVIGLIASSLNQVSGMTHGVHSRSPWGKNALLSCLLISIPEVPESVSWLGVLELFMSVFHSVWWATILPVARMGTANAGRISIEFQTSTGKNASTE